MHPGGGTPRSAGTPRSRGAVAMMSSNSGSPSKKARGIGGACAGLGNNNPSELLMEPTEECPWMVEIVNVLPEKLQQQQALSQAESTVRAGRWMAMVSRPPRPDMVGNDNDHGNSRGSGSSGGYQIHVWHPAPLASFADQKFKTPVLRLTHPEFFVDCSLPLLVRLQSSTATTSLLPMDDDASTTFVFLYVVHPGTGKLWFWKLSTADLKKGFSPSFKTSIKLPLSLVHDNHYGQNLYEGEGSSSFSPAEVITCLTVQPRQLLLGTSSGRVFWVRQNQNVLTVENPPSPSPFHSSMELRSRGHSSISEYISRFVFRSSGEEDDADSALDQDGDGRPTLFLVQALFLDAKQQPSHTISSTSSGSQNDSSFCVLTRQGLGVVYKAHRKDDYTPSTNFTQTHTFSLKNDLRAHLVLRGSIQQRLASLQVVQAAFGAIPISTGRVKKQLHVLVRVVIVSRSAVAQNTKGTAATAGDNDDNDDDHNDHNESSPNRFEEEHRLYWLRLEDKEPQQSQSQQTTGHEDKWALTKAIWLDRFVMPQQVQVVGLQVAENGVGYAAFVRRVDSDGDDDNFYNNNNIANSSIPILIALDLSNHVYEVDLHMVVDTTILGLFADERTFGCNLVTLSGTLIRAECKEATDMAAEYLREDDREAANSTAAVMDHPNKVKMLVNHLRATFWDCFRDPDRTILLPPSIERAEKQDLETAIVKLAQELQKDVSVIPRGSSTVATLATQAANMVLSRHLEFVDFLQRAKIFRSLMPITKWHLMAIGQEIAAYQAVASLPQEEISSSMKPALESLTSFNLALWFKGVQSKVLEQGFGEDAQRLFVTWLEQALEAAMLFRKDRSTLTYDIATSAKPPTVGSELAIPLWTSKPVLQKVLDRQIGYWLDGSQEASGLGASAKVLEVVVVATLQSYRDSYLALPCDSTRLSYSRTQTLVINLLRKVNGNAHDALAWSLCKEHSYFWGLCQIAHDYRREGSSDYNLVPLFNKYSGESDIVTDLSFGKYVIKWHIDRNLLGDALKYGSYCESDLLIMLNSEAKLRPYRWVVSLQQGNYEPAAQNLVEGAGRVDVSLAQAKFNLAMAKLANKMVVEKQLSRREVAMINAKIIENKREIVHAQEQLLGAEDARDSNAWSAPYLLQYAKEKLSRSTDREAKAQICFIALTLCASLEVSVEEQKNEAADIWYLALMADWAFLSSILRGDQVLTDDGIANSVLQKSVFGKLVEKCDSIDLDHVGIDNMMERVIVDKFGREDQSRMHQILRTTLTRM